MPFSVFFGRMVESTFRVLAVGMTLSSVFTALLRGKLPFRHNLHLIRPSGTFSCLRQRAQAPKGEGPTHKSYGFPASKTE
jgi:hypothetical protein